MILKLKKQSATHEEVVKNVFDSRGIKDIHSFLNPNENSVPNPEIFNNMKQAAELLEKYKKEENVNCIVLTDSDCDGNCSAAIIYNYLKDTTTFNIDYFVHEEKNHGLTEKFMNYVLDKQFDLIIVPDASSNDFEQHKILKNNNIDVIIIDHHDTTHYSNDAIVINNQLDKKYEHYTGSMMTYMFTKYLDKINNTNFADKNLDLAIIGNNADMGNMATEDMRYLTEKTFKMEKRPFLQHLLKKDNISYQTMSWNIGPAINSIIRIGNLDEKKALFEALTNQDTYYPLMYRNKPKDFHSTEYAARIVKLMKDKQKDYITNCLEKTKIDDSKRIFVKQVDENTLPASVGGLFANRVMSTIEKPVFILRETSKDNSILGGSVRAPGHFKNFKDKLESMNIFELTQGHQNAFGVEIKKDNLEKFIEMTQNDDYFLSNKKDNEIEVDVIFNDNNINSNYEDIISLINTYKRYYCIGFDPIKIGIDFKDFSTKQINICGKDMRTIQIRVNNITAIKFKVTDEEIEYIKNNDTVDIIGYGEADVNIYQSKIYKQIKLDEVEITKNNKNNNETQSYFANPFNF